MGENGLVSRGMEQCLSSFCFVGKIFIPWLDLRAFVSRISEAVESSRGFVVLFSFLLDLRGS